MGSEMCIRDRWYEMPEAAANGLILFMMAVMAAALLMYVPVFRKMKKEV